MVHKKPDAEIQFHTFGHVRKRLIKLHTEETLFYSDKNEKKCHEADVELLLSKKAAKSLLEWDPLSDHIIRARCKKVSIVTHPQNTQHPHSYNNNQIPGQLPKRPPTIHLIQQSHIKTHKHQSRCLPRERPITHSLQHIPLRHSTPQNQLTQPHHLRRRHHHNIIPPQHQHSHPERPPISQ